MTFSWKLTAVDWAAALALMGSLPSAGGSRGVSVVQQLAGHGIGGRPCSTLVMSSDGESFDEI